MEDWLPDAKRVYRGMPQGRDEARLLEVDISGTTGPDFEPGSYVVRVGPADDGLVQRNELAAHNKLRDAAPEFAENHIPRLLRIRTVEADDGSRPLVVSLQQLAGGGTHRYVSPRGPSTALQLTAERLSHELLTAWALPHEMREQTPHELLVDLAGGAPRATECLDGAEAFFPDGRHEVTGGQTFVDPRKVLAPGRGEQVPLMYGFCHGDLHTGNLLVPSSELAGVDSGYWIVDLDRTRHGAVGFDLAYLEVSVLVNLLPDLDPVVLSRCLTSAEGISPRQIPDGTDWLMAFLESSRRGIRQWTSAQQGRMDHLERQFMLVRMVTGLLWARRFEPGSPKARLCLAYAGCYAFHYDSVYGIDGSDPVVEASAGQGSDPAGPDEQRRTEAEETLWQSLWDATSGFASHAGRYVLIAERMPAVDTVAALGRIPWSVVLDLDPRSDADGLQHRAKPVLDAQRAVHLFTQNQPQVDYGRGTAWMLAVGSVLLNEPPEDLRNWGYRRLSAIRRLASSFRESVGDTPVFVVVLEGNGEGSEGGLERDRLLRTLEAVDEMLQGRGTFLHIGQSPLATRVEATRVPLPLPAFLDRLSDTLGQEPEQTDFTLPSLEQRTAAISPDTMQRLREHLVVLHDGIELTEPATPVPYNDEFWRGGLIRWSDLDADRDVPRTVANDLMAALRDSLENHHIRTVLLRHLPGAGGTTVALRAAWDLHHEYPVAVLPHGIAVDRSRVALIAARIDLLYSRTQMPVLLVAESGDLSESDREMLYQELSKRGARVTMLYVRRVVADGESDALQVTELLDATETREFERRYKQLVVDPSRLSELRKLSQQQYEQYRTPFFYGLVTFERNFTKLSDYVKTHLENVRGQAAKVMTYLAIVTIFSNSGLQRDTVQKLMRLAPGTTLLELSDVLGPEAARLVTVRAGRVRLQHQLIAEQALVEILMDENWDAHLKDQSIDFIEALAFNTDTSSKPIRLLLKQLFVDRQGGTVDGVEDRGQFAPLIDRLDDYSAHAVLRSLTERVPDDPHYWTHLGRHQIYRLNEGYAKAEEYVSRAVALDENDFIHHHALGLTRKKILKEELNEARSHGLAAVMSVVEAHYERTVECFVTSRRINKENRYAYITHVQSIIDVARAMKAAARVKSITDLPASAGEWVKLKVAEARDLLRDATRAYATLDGHSTYIASCHAAIRSLHGDLNAAVETWELAVAGRQSNTAVRRALAHAYHLRSEADGTPLSHAELRRVVQLARQNLSRHDCREEDYRLWFEAYRKLPEFDITESLSELQLWLDRFPSWRAHYYRYCLLFHQWFSGNSNQTEQFRYAQQQSSQLVLGRSTWSPLWLAKGPEWYPVISDTDLGEWDRKRTFWKNPEPLQRVNGVLDGVYSQLKGTIMLAGRVSADFRPQRGGFLDGEENTEVNFYLGMSSSGLRAYEVERGHHPEGVTARQLLWTALAASPAEGGTAGPEADTARVGAGAGGAADRPVLSTEEILAHAAEISDEQKLDFCLSLLRAWDEVERTASLSDLVARVRARYRYDGTDVEALLEQSGQVQYFGDEDDPEIRLLGSPLPKPAGQAPRSAQSRRSVKEPAEWLPSPRPSHKVLGQVLTVNEESRTAVVVHADNQYATLRLDDVLSPPQEVPRTRQLLWMKAEPSGKGGGSTAREVELLPPSATVVDDELIPADRLWDRVESDLRDEMDAQVARGASPVREATLAAWLEARFNGCQSLAERLGLADLSLLWGGLDWLHREGTGRRATLAPTAEPVFGRVNLPRQEGEVSGKKPEVPVPAPAPAAPPTPRPPSTPLPTFGEALSAVVDQLRLRNGAEDPTWSDVRSALNASLGANFATVVGPEGGRSLRKKLLQEPGWELVGKPPHPSRVRRTAAVPAARTAPDIAPDISADIADVLRELAAQGQEPMLTKVGSRLRSRWGLEAYKRITASQPLTGLVRQHGWEVTEIKPSVHYIRRPAEPAEPAEPGGSQDGTRTGTQDGSRTGSQDGGDER
ncbi:phosphotransferase [Streptomyces sp. NPDC056463]|uniref:phosphotransferase n=1 Tax=Streptomyces sp. NPDC056463 TaxID=3345827 RepID=UPI003690D1FA